MVLKFQTPEVRLYLSPLLKKNTIARSVSYIENGDLKTLKNNGTRSAGIFKIVGRTGTVRKGAENSKKLEIAIALGVDPLIQILRFR
ncbi:hypothetical protein AP285_09390 [Limnospira platensis YZ]|nr:hypothetical protein AP285_09390 [Arthrospira platensis YZ]KDR58205.1 hypothetical protein APPUASWS_006465 [Arthrospira platensis str. Paraca]